MTGAGQGADELFSKALLTAINAHFACGEYNDDGDEEGIRYSKLSAQADEATDEVERLYTALLREVDGLKAALDKYGWHKHRCAAIDDECTDMRYPEIACTCGFDAALSPASGGV